MPTFVDDDGTYAPPPKGHKTATHTLTWNTLTIPKDQVPWKWLYKCVVVQKRNRAITDDTGEILESGVLDQNPFWTYVEPSGLDGFEVCRLGSKYDLWLSDVIVDGSYSFLEIREKASWDESYQPPRMNPDWFGNWWVETPGRAPYAFAQQPDPNNPDGFRQIQYDANIDYVIQYVCDEFVFVFNTKEIKEILDGVPINQVEIMMWLKDYIKEGMRV